MNNIIESIKNVSGGVLTIDGVIIPNGGVTTPSLGWWTTNSYKELYQYNGVEIYTTDNQVMRYSINGDTYVNMFINTYNYKMFYYNILLDISTKQDKLISGVNIKTVGGVSILGSGDIPVSGSGGNAINVQSTATGWITATNVQGALDQIGKFNPNLMQPNEGVWTGVFEGITKGPSSFTFQNTLSGSNGVVLSVSNPSKSIAFVTPSNSGSWRGMDGVIVFESLITFNALSTATEEYIFSFGLESSFSGNYPQTNMCSIVYDRVSYGHTLNLLTRVSGTTGSVAASMPISAGTRYSIRLEISNGILKWYVNKSLIGSIAYPFNVTPLCLGMRNNKKTGTGSSEVVADYIWAYQRFNTPLSYVGTFDLF